MLHVLRTSDGELPPAKSIRPAGAKAPPDRIAISSVYGQPTDPLTWSGAPNNIATALERLGIEVPDVFARLSRIEKIGVGAQYLLSGYGLPQNSETLFRSAGARRRRAARVAAFARRHGIKHLLHTGTLDLPVCGTDDVDHYLYCDQTWDLSLRYRADKGALTKKGRDAFESMERDCYRQMRHIFTFGDYVRDNLIAHYGVERARVTTVGSGMGQIEPYFGAKDHGAGLLLLFVAKHLFEAKGGYLVLDAFRLARKRRPDLRLVAVWDGRDAGLPRRYPEVEFRTRLRWGTLTALYRNAALLVQPMLNDPWGQVYLEALVSRTPVIGLNRNGLPEIAGYGEHGFLIDEPDGAALAGAVLDAVSDPARLTRMGLAGQRHVLRHYSWDRAVEKMVAVMAER